MMETKTNLQEALKDFFGFSTFKGNQEAIIKSVMDGNDTFVIMPTGGGKSLCYQLPALITEGTAIIISPLIALMKNQVDQVRSYSNMDNVAHFLNSSLTKRQIKKVRTAVTSGETKLLYVAPETLVKEENIQFFKSINISFVAVDEAHCISEWGHDFRPEYRKIRHMIDAIGDEIPIVALTATATPKVQSDIQKNLKMKDPEVYISSFLRENLYYEIKPKGQKSAVIKDIVRFIKGRTQKSGIIYCLNRKTTEELAQVLTVNGIKAAPYHAGLDSAVRTKTQDQFLMEDIEVIVATIAFGMGIDKPDVRFVIHFNIPKSLENYYQETGRAGRDGLEGNCIAYFSYKDINKLEKFLRDKPVAEREIGAQHLMEMSAYSESTACRRQFLLHYFGEEYDTSACGNGECDNCAHPKSKEEVKDEMKMALQAVEQVNENYGIQNLVRLLMGRKAQEATAYKDSTIPAFGKGKSRDDNFWNSIYRHALLNNLVEKNIEEYGLLVLTDKGRKYIKDPFSVEVAINRNYEEINDEVPYEDNGQPGALDPLLLNMLRDLRKKVSKQKDLPPFVIFQDPSLEDMATQYPITMDELSDITGVSRGKAVRYGRKFIDLIKDYVEENNIDRPTDFKVKSVVNKSVNKVFIIQNIDRKVPLQDIAAQKEMSRDEFFDELETIIASGTRINIDYYINDVLDEDIQDIIYDYFRNAETDNVDIAYRELEDEGITREEIQMMRIKFMSEMAN